MQMLALIQVRAGNTGLHLLASNIRAQWWRLASLVVALAVLGLIAGDWLKGLIPAAILLGLILCILGIIVVILLFHARSTITVTPTELVVKRVRRRTIQRCDIGDAVVGLFGTVPQSPSMLAESLSLVITDRDGETFVKLPMAFWPTDGLDDVLHELRITAHVANEAESKRLTPFVARRPFLTGLIGAAVLIVLIVVVVVIVEHHRASSAADEASRLEGGWDTYAVEHLTADRFPGLASSEVSAFADDDVHLSIHADLTGPGPEFVPAQTLALVEAACDYSADKSGVDASVRLQLHSEQVSRKTGDHREWRTLVVDCDAERALLTTWLDWAVRHPWPASQGRIWVEQRGGADDDHPVPLELRLDLNRTNSRAFRAGFEHVCSFTPSEDQGVLRSLSASAAPPAYDASDVDCSAVDDELAQWKASAGRH